MSTEAVRQKVLQQLGRTYRIFLSAFEAEVGHCAPRWRILWVLHERQAPCSHKELAELLQMDAGALSRQLKALVAAGWMTRRADASDHRMIQLELTAAGRAEIMRSLPRRTRFYEAFLGDIPETELQTLHAALENLEQRLAHHRR